MNNRIVAMLCAVTLAGCGGGAAVQPATSSSTQTNAFDATVASTIVVPGTSAGQSTARTAQYVSASSLGLKVIVTDVPPSGKTASFNPITSVYTLNVGLNQIIIPTPTSAAGHTEDLTYVDYDLTPVAGAIPTNAKALGWTLTTGFVVQPGQNTNDVVLSGVADNFPAPLAETGAFGMMSAAPPTLAGAQTSLGFGGNAVPNGSPTLFDAGGNDITTAAGSPWPIVDGIPTSATLAASGVPVTIAETAGTCGAIGAGPHLMLSYDGGTPSTSASIVKTSDTIAAEYDGNGGAGWYAVVSAKAQSQTLTYTLSTLAVTAAGDVNYNVVDWSCTNQTLSFSQSNERWLMTVVEHNASTPYTITEPNTSSCTGLVNVYAGNSVAPANLIAPGVATSLGANTNFTVELIPVPAGAYSCTVELQDANAAATGGASFPGATTYVTAVLPQAAYSIIVP